ncbi:MAG: preprotein translocase subunit SecY [Nanoarchaeota archaeon]|nr:preprotein translocase subunit SecY [Nanoarchaeota archaeon]MBU1704666.1 preprotein translocase subunit SecY [Nanoarchaeota archaeon]
MGIWKNILANLPEVASPTQKRLSFKEKLKWTLTIVIAYFVLGLLPLFGLGANALEQFEYLSIILGAKFGSLISLGIGPLVTASIVLQLLNGSGIVKFDLASHEGKKNFQGVQKLLSIFFIIFEAGIYVFMGGLSPPTTMLGSPLFFQIQLLLIFQLFLGGILIMFMDEVVSKWGFGSGISLFIAAGVSQEIFIQAFNWLPPAGVPTAGYASGAIPALIQALASQDPVTAGIKFAAVVSTLVVFAVAVYAQAMKVEIPLSFGRIRGHGIRWPLSFMYTSNIPVILVAALIANVQLWARLLQSWGRPLLGTFNDGGQPISGFIYWIQSPNLVRTIIEQKTFLIGSDIYLQSLIYLIFMIGGSVLFSIFWVQTSGMDARSQAKQMMSSGLQIPGFRKDERVLERLLNRYIWPLTVMGAIAVGFLAALADLTGALSRGTGILLTVMIIYKLYEEIAKQHMMDMNPMMRKFMGGF